MRHNHNDAEFMYKQACHTASDINEHLPTLRTFAERCEIVTELGVRNVVSSWALFAAAPKQMTSVDVWRSPNVDYLYQYAIDTEFTFIQADCLTLTPAVTNLLFIDTYHTFSQLIRELELFAPTTTDYIAMHDTYTYGNIGEDGDKGLKFAIDEFKARHTEWVTVKEYNNCNGLTILQRRS